MKPINPLDLVPLSGTHHYSGDANERMKNIKKLHEEVREKILKHNEKYMKNAYKHQRYVEFKEGDLVWVHLRNERFSHGKFSKLHPRVDEPFLILQRFGENAYKVELPTSYEVSSTFRENYQKNT